MLWSMVSKVTERSGDKGITTVIDEAIMDIQFQWSNTRRRKTDED